MLPTQKAQLLKELTSLYSKETTETIQLAPKATRKQQVLDIALQLNEATLVN